MPENNSPNFYLALCKKGKHSYVIIGQVDNAGRNTVLMRVGKQDLFHPKTAGFFSKAFYVFKVAAGVPAMLKDEGLGFGWTDFKYKAFDLSLNQLADFYRLVSEIQSTQSNNVELQSAFIEEIIKKDAKLAAKYQEQEFISNRKEGKLPEIWNNQILSYKEEKEILNKNFNIKAILPIKKDDGSIEYRTDFLGSSDYTEIEKNWPPSNLNQSANSIDTSKLTFVETCRTTALKLLESILGKEHGISKLFVISPGYSMEVNSNGNLKSPLYLLPPPYNCFKDLDKKKTELLKIIFKRLEAIPHIDKNKQTTEDKFNTLKRMYLDISGDNKLNIANYLESIEQIHSKILFKKRTPSFLSRLFHLESSTERLFKQMKKDYNKTNEPTNENWEKSSLKKNP